MSQIATDIAINPPSCARIELAPEFEAHATHGWVRLSDYRGRWLLLLSHPAVLAPVCSSEFIARQRAAEQFDALDCDELGWSVDSVYAPIAWMKDIDVRLGVCISGTSRHRTGPSVLLHACTEPS